jgi:2-polyprenyl-3-methyl-5-hydroxy-6-metoxy-1,4-benzoquinol methylase
MRRLEGATELLDGPLDRETLRGNLRDLARINAWLGGAALSRRAIVPFSRGPGEKVRVLDVGTGAADIPLYLFRSTAYRGLGLHFEAIDVRPEIVEIARHTVRRHRVEVRLGRLEDEAANAYDVVHCSLVLHHLDPEDAVAFLAEMARVASRAVIVNDLDRAERWLLAAKLLTRLTTRNRYTRNDAPLSVQRAYRPDELVQLAARAGLVEESRRWTFPRYRYALTFRHAATPSA